MTEDFDVKLVEDVKSYTPDPQYRKNAWMSDYQKTYAGFLADPDGFWERMAKELNWIQAMGCSKGMELSVRKVVYQRQTEHLGKLP